MSMNPERVVTRHEFSGLFCQAWESSMTMTNIRAGFRVTGIHPFNRNALSESNPSKSPEKLKYIPLLTPSRSNLSTEEARFEARYAEWLQKNHPEAVNSSYQTSSHEQPEDAPQLVTSESFHRMLHFEEASDDDVSHHHTTTLTKTLSSMPKPKLKYPEIKESNSNRVLTSLENLKKIEKKEKEKEDKARDKQKRAEERELKRLRKEEEKRNKGQKKPRKSKKSATTGKN